MLLGKYTPVVDQYSPELLYSIPRAQGRATLGLAGTLPFHGADLWHAYEMSWLDGEGKPVVAVGRFHVPADSPHIVESKSFKLYLNSLNSSRFVSVERVRETVLADISGAAGAPVELELLSVDAAELSGYALKGACLDDLEIEVTEAEPEAGIIRAGEAVVEESLYTHLLRSLCPVTGQPDWATVWIHYRGRAVDRNSLLTYLVAFRRHREFHEQCVERIFVDLQQTLSPESLQVQAFYTRRGGLDISPFRCTEPDSLPLPRLDRQ